MNFQQKIAKILRDEQLAVLKESEEAYGTHSPTQVAPEKGEEVTSSLDGSGKIDANGPIPTGLDKTLKTTPGVSATEGPTGHVPTNSDLPRKQLDGLDKDNKDAGKDSLPPTPKVYGLHEEEEEKKDAVKEEKKELPPFMKKKEMKEEVKEEKDEVKEESEAARTLKSPPAGDGEKAAKLKTEEFDNEEGDKSKASVKEEKDDEKADKKAVKEAAAALFVGETISEALKTKTTALFETALSNRIKDYRTVLVERYTKQLNQRVETIREELSATVDGHLDLVVENWVKTNEVPLEKALKAELVEDFIGGLKALFEEHYIELPADKVDVVSEMVTRITKLEGQLNEALETNGKLQSKNKLHERTETFERVSKGLAATQVEKLRSLSENVEFKSTSQYETALATLKESVEGTTQRKEEPKTITEQLLDSNDGEPVVPEENDFMMKSVKKELARFKK